MPEVLEVELTRRALAPVLAGRRIDAVVRTDPLVVGTGVDDAVRGAVVEGLRRHGKLLVVDTDGPVIGVHLGMTGRLLADEWSPVGRLAYASASDDARWDRWVSVLDDGLRLRLHDPRRFGRIRLDPSTGGLGPDVLGLRAEELARALAGRTAPVKAVLLDQARVAGLGNLLGDEVLWWAAIDPRRPAGSLGATELEALHRAIRRRLPVMLRRGGSHTGTLSPLRRAVGGPCPRCAGSLERSVVAGRTTVRCAAHQC